MLLEYRVEEFRRRPDTLQKRLAVGHIGFRRSDRPLEIVGYEQEIAGKITDRKLSDFGCEALGSLAGIIGFSERPHQAVDTRGTLILRVRYFLVAHRLRLTPFALGSRA
jgi:hypothetical protein